MLSKFWVKNFRNLHEVLLELEACKSMIITGENNQGKTSLLEAIYLCNNGRSPIERDFQTIISFNSENSLLGTESIIGNQKKKVYLKINQDGTKSVTIDQKVYTTFQRKHLLRTMFMSADCLRLFHESPDKRRAEWDNFCTDFFDDYKSLLDRYFRLIKQKNRALKEGADIKEIMIFNEQLVPLSSAIVCYRVKSLQIIEKQLTFFVSKLDIGKPCNIVSVFKGFSNYNFSDLEDYSKRLTLLLNSYIDKEKAIGFSLICPHRDDFYLICSDKCVHRFFSRGINRIIAFMFLLSHMILINKQHKSSPVLLLDDTFAEIHHHYKNVLLSLIPHDIQFFYTSVDEHDHHLFGFDKAYYMNNGKLEKIESI